MMTPNSFFKRPLIWATFSLVLALLQGCATAPGGNPSDPFESFNRSVFSFNDKVDVAVLKPVATVYRDVTPSPVRTGVTNFFGNVSDAWSVVNNALQAKPQFALESLFRVTVNTLFGLGGLLDVAGEAGIPKHTEDFGQTLGHWGVASGPYLVLPILGPSTVRDTAALVVDTQGDAVAAAGNVAVRNSLMATRVVNVRSRLLDAGDLLDEAALDKYSFARDVHLQRRRSLVARNPGETEERFDLPETGSGAVTVPAATK
jgi:phospholipid-binding lipoprotein MlaA